MWWKVLWAALLGAGLMAPAVAEPLVREARGVVQPSAEAVIASEIAGRIVAMQFRPGEHFDAGDVLVQLDCALYAARVAISSAVHDAAALRVESKQQLAALASIGVLEVRLAEAQLAEATAALQLDQLWAERCTIRAPFAGLVVEQMARPAESVLANDPLLAILSVERPELRLVVPSHWLSRLVPGTPFRFAIDETGEVIDAVLTRIGPRIDPVSQTLPVFAELIDPVEDIVAGMSGTARFVHGLR